MREGDFEWDEAKAVQNYVQHRVSFETAKRVFEIASGSNAWTTVWIVGRTVTASSGWLTGGSSSWPSRCETVGFASFPRVQPNQLKDEIVMIDGSNQTKQPNTDWSRFDEMSEAERHEAALNDPDAQPLTESDLARIKAAPQVKVIRRALGLSQEDFTACYQIPIETVRDWEQGRIEPDPAARAYLRVIATEPDMVRKALAPRKIA
jgi:putative transcriptional regulator